MGEVSPVHLLFDPIARKPWKSAIGDVTKGPDTFARLGTVPTACPRGFSGKLKPNGVKGTCKQRATHAFCFIKVKRI